MNATKLGGICAISLILVACETAYHEKGEYAGIPSGGYSETYVNSNTVIVSYDGNDKTPPGKIYEYLMYRCARVTINHGYNYFVITSETDSPTNIHVHTVNRRTVTTPPNLNDTYYYKTRVTGFDETCTSANCRTPNVHGNVTVIKMFTGRIPPGMPRAYDALDVIAHTMPATF